MKKIFILALCVLVAGIIPSWTQQTANKIKVLVVTGGHGFEREPFFRMFKENPEIEFTAAAHARTNATVYERDDLFNYDVLVLYDMPKEITERQKERFKMLLEKGTGIVALHHSLVAYQKWDEYERIIGGRYPEEPGKEGVVTPQVGYEHDVDVPIVILDREHPITKGLSDFTINDEVYWGFSIGKDVKPIITTTHPKSGKPIGWVRTEKASRIVYLQPGHGPKTYDDKNYRELLARAIKWAAKR